MDTLSWVVSSGSRKGVDGHRPKSQHTKREPQHHVEKLIVLLLVPPSALLCLQPTSSLL